MPNTVAVGVETNCTAPLRVERLSMRIIELHGRRLAAPARSLPWASSRARYWKPEYTPAAKMIPSTDAFFDPFVMLGDDGGALPRACASAPASPSRSAAIPSTLAQAFVTVDHMTKGRAILGIGNGERENTEPYGMPFTQAASAVSRRRSTIIRRLWESRGEPVDFDGAIWRLRKALFTTPLYKGKARRRSGSRRTRRACSALTGRFADGWYPTQKMTPDEYAERARRASAPRPRRRADRSTRFEPALQIQVALGADRRQVLEQLVQGEAGGGDGPAAARRRCGAKHGLRHPLGEHFEGFADIRAEEVTPRRSRPPSAR